MKISVIVGFRNRDLLRVQRHLDSFKSQIYSDFEILFIDYGSDPMISKNIETLVSKYGFCQYIYNETRGMPWNRSHALNSGLKIAKGKYILFGDIDLIYSNNFLSNIISSKKPNIQLFQQVYWLPEKFNDWHSINLNIEGLYLSDSGSKGGVHLIERQKLVDIGGYDEFYCFWGHEDNDLFLRLENYGLETEWLEPNLAPVYHQWHPISTSETKNFMPDRWWDLMTIYLNINRERIVRNENQWGRILSIADRHSLTSQDIIKYNNSIFKNSFERAAEYRRIIQGIEVLETGQCMEINISDLENDIKLSKMEVIGRKIINFLIKFLKLPFVLLFKEHLKNLELNKPNAKSDILYMVWQLILAKEIGDYAIMANKSDLVIRITGKNR